MIVYTNGCSHTDDHPWKERYDLDHKNTFVWSVKVMDKLSNNYKYIRNLNNYVGDSSLTDYLISDAVSGAGNDHIYHSTLESIGTLFNLGMIPDLVIIQWTGPSRREHIMADGHYRIFINPTENTEYQLKFEPMGSTHSLHYIYSLQELFKSKNIKYLFFNYIPLSENIKKLSIYKQIDFDKFVNFEDDKETIFTGLVDLIIDKKFNNDVMGHANPDGNIFISNKILDKIKTL